MDEAPPERLGPYARFGMIGLGLAALAAAVPAGFVGLVLGGISIGGWHGVTPRPVDWTVGLSLLTLPLLLLALGAFSLACTTPRRGRIVAALAAAVAVDGSIALYSLALSARAGSPASGVTTYPDVESARKAYGWPPDPAFNAAEGRAAKKPGREN